MQIICNARNGLNFGGLILLLIMAAGSALQAAELQGALQPPVPAPEIQSPAPWLNSPPLTSQQLKGKVVLVDFWTYSCINCLRTLPYLKAWYAAYKDQGFEIIGVHAPEFDFEKSQANVEKALKRFQVTWPIVLDNAHLIWNRFHNQYWPAKYLISRDGQIVYSHFGEGNYDVTENNIRALLQANGGMAQVSDVGNKAALNQSLETYLGTSRAERMMNASLMNVASQVNTYDYPKEIEHDSWALSGNWQRYDERSVARAAGAGLRLRFRGGKVFLVMGTEDGKPVKARILYNGQPATIKAGKDVKDGVVEVTDHRLYELLDLKGFEEALFEIQAERPGLELYAFTFGG